MYSYGRTDMAKQKPETVDLKTILSVFGNRRWVCTDAIFYFGILN